MNNWSSLKPAEKIAALTSVLDLIWTLPEEVCHLDMWAQTPEKASADVNACGTTFCLAGWLAHHKDFRDVWNLALRPVVTPTLEGDNTCITFRLDRHVDGLDLEYDERGCVFNPLKYQFLGPEDILDGDPCTSGFLFGASEYDGADGRSQRDEMIFRLIAATSCIYLVEHNWTREAFEHVGLEKDGDYEDRNDIWEHPIYWFACHYDQQLWDRVAFMKFKYNKQGK